MGIGTGTSDRRRSVRTAHWLGEKKSLQNVLLVGALMLGASVLFFLNPSTTVFYPKCLFHEMTGLYCPGCGSTRALHCLLHGEVVAALHENALAVLAVPLLGGILFVRAIRRRPATATPGFAWGWLVLLLAVILAFGVVRNIPRRPFSRFAPPAEVAGK